MRLITGIEGSGPILRLEAPLSFWGGVDTRTGLIIDANHPQAGVSVQGVLLAMPRGRGSSSSSTVLAESIRSGTGPAGLILSEMDEILLVGALVANDLYQVGFPVAVGELPQSSRSVWTLNVSGVYRR